MRNHSTKVAIYDYSQLQYSLDRRQVINHCYARGIITIMTGRLSIVMTAINHTYYKQFTKGAIGHKCPGSHGYKSP
jgi:hypothetical protein